MLIVEFGIFSYSMLLLLLLPLGWYGRLLIGLELQKEPSLNPFIISFFCVVANIIFGSYEFFRRLKRFIPILNRKQSIEQEKIISKLKKQTQVKIVMVKQSFNILPYILISLSSISECTFVCSFFSINGTVFYEMNVILLILSSFSTYYILGYQIFKHKKVSVAIISMNIIALYAQQKFDSITSALFSFFQNLVLYISVGTLDINQKYTMEMNHFSPFRVIFFQGITSSLYILIGLAFVIPYLPCNDKAYCLNGSYGSLTESMTLFFNTLSIGNKRMLFAFYVSFCGIYIVLLLFTHQQFTPTHRIFSESIASMLYYLLNEREARNLMWLTIIRFIIVLFVSLIYNDILIINLWGLGVNTRKNIIKRSRKEVKALINDIPEMELINNTLGEETYNEDNSNERNSNMNATET